MKEDPVKGVIFCLLEKMVVARSGPDAWEQLVALTPLRTVGGFLGPATYPDEDLFALVQTASDVTGRPVGELLRAFGRFIFPDLVRLHPDFVPAGMTARQLLLRVERVIHVEVAKLHPGAEMPHFECEAPAPDALVMLYRSPRRMCEFAAGLIEGVGDYFDESIAQAHPLCMHRGHPRCRFELRFSPAVR